MEESGRVPESRRSGDAAQAGGRAAAMENARFAVVECDAADRIVGWNAGATAIFGYTRQEAIGQSIELILPPAGRDVWKRIQHGDGRGSRPCQGLHKDGSSLVCEWLHEPVLDAEGRPAGVLCIGSEATARARESEQLRHDRTLLSALLESVSIILWAVDRDGKFTFHDGKGLESFGLQRGQFLGLNLFDLYAGEPENADAVRKALQGEARHWTSETVGIAVESWLLPVRDEHGDVVAVAGVTVDVSESRRKERELQARVDLIEQQQRVIRDLSTPIIEVWDRVLTLPMVGVVDSARTAEVMDNLLEAVVRTQARFAILDLTGVEMVDTKTASYLIELVRAIRLLGAEGIITGIRPTVAQTMVALGLDMTGVITRANLRAGLKLCIQRMLAAPVQGAAKPAP